MERIIEVGLGLDIIPLRGDPALSKISAYLMSDLTGIVVDHDQYMDRENRYANRLRFSFAHEVGHLVLHDYFYRQFSFRSVEDYLRFERDIPEERHRDFEWQANEFAGSLLVPREILSSEIDRVCERLKKSKGLIDLLRSEPETVLFRISPTVRRPFGVSDEVIERRIRVEGFWPPVL
jgi:Zn-dependent peptidase ImmA (M78 family)